jgi:hypothetical protein
MKFILNISLIQFAGNENYFKTKGYSIPTFADKCSSLQAGILNYPAATIERAISPLRF